LAKALAIYVENFAAPNYSMPFLAALGSALGVGSIPCILDTKSNVGGVVVFLLCRFISLEQHASISGDLFLF
tara:strand:+ start:210 stop:425 length:216 start_codon:yes stop_codon:yes gene_type:complete